MVNFKTPMIQDKKSVNKVVDKIELIFKEIKKNEISPSTDYLFNGIDKRSNIDKTIEKLDIMKNF